VLSAAMRVAKKRSQLLALVGLGLELLLRDRTICADDAELLVALEAAADHHHAVDLITALHSAADVSRVYVQIMEQARCTLKRMGIRLLDDKQPTDFEEAERNLMTLLRALRTALSPSAVRRHARRVRPELSAPFSHDTAEVQQRFQPQLIGG
jgi:hypothetical protein